MLVQEMQFGLGATASAFIGSTPTKVLPASVLTATVHGSLPATWKSVYDLALQQAPNSANGISVGAAPFAKLVNLQTGKLYAPTYDSRDNSRTFRVFAATDPWSWKSIPLPVVYFIEDSDEALGAYLDKYGPGLASAISSACATGGNLLQLLHLDAVGTTAARVAAAACQRYKPAPAMTTAPVRAGSPMSPVTPLLPNPNQSAPDLPVGPTASGVAPDAGGGGSYKPGSFSRYNKTRGTFSVYSPLAGYDVFSGQRKNVEASFFGVTSLGDGVLPEIPTGFVKVGEEITAAAAAARGAPVTGEEKDKGGLFSNPYFWLGVGGVVLVGGGIVIWRRRSSSVPRRRGA